MNKIVILTFLAVFLVSCRNESEYLIKGKWSIDTISYRENEVRGCFLSNIIEFKNEEVDLPIAENMCDSLIKKANDRFGQWEMIDNSEKRKLKINTPNEVFSGSHSFRFIKDEKNKLLKIELKSDNLFIIARKGLFEYDSNIDVINRVTGSK